MAGSVFGLGSSLNTTLTTYCLICIVIFTVVFESLTHHAGHKLKGTPYMEMLAKVYKEMMIMGFISFGIFMAVQAGGVGHGETLVAFEFAHIVVFFAALIFVLTALVFIFVSYHLKILYERSASTTADHLLTEYALVRYSPWFHKMHWLGGSSKLRDMMEFKIVHLHFQKVYDLPHDFNFASYMQECLDHYILDLIEVEPSTWIVFMALALLNLGIMKLVDLITDGSNDIDDDSYHESSSESHHSTSSYDDYSSSYSSGSGCDHSTSTSHSHRWLGGSSSATSSHSSDYYSEGGNGLFVFILCGWFLVAWVVFLYVAARHSELRLLLKTGAQSTHHYESVLVQVEEELKSREREREAEGQELLSLEELQGKIAQLKAELEQAHEEEDLERHASDLEATLNQPLSPLSKALPRPLANGALALHQGTGKLITQTSYSAKKALHHKSSRGFHHGMSSGSRTSSKVTPFTGSSSGKESTADPAPAEASLTIGDEATDTFSPGMSSGSRTSSKVTPFTGSSSGKESTADPAPAEASLTIGDEATDTLSPVSKEEPAAAPPPQHRRSLGNGAFLSGAAHRAKAELREKQQQLQLKLAALAALSGGGGGGKAGGGKPAGRRAVHTDTFYENEALSKQLAGAPHPSIAEPTADGSASSGTRNGTLTLKSDIHDVYPFGSRHFFEKAIEIFLLLACTYGALYFANFCIVAQSAASFAPAAVSHLLMLAPAFIFVPVMGRVVKTSSLLQAVAEIKPGIIAKVIEETIDTQKMAATVSEKIKAEITRLGGDPITSKDILLFFDAYANKPGSGEMGPRDFRFALHRMRVHLSDTRFLRLFKHFELNKDGALTAQEAAQVLWPAEAAAEAEQARRLRGHQLAHHHHRGGGGADPGKRAAAAAAAAGVPPLLLSPAPASGGRPERDLVTKNDDN